MKLAYIILCLIFLLTAGYGLEKFFAVLREKPSAAIEPDKQGSKNIQVKSRLADIGTVPPDSVCDVQVLLSNDFFDLSRNVISGRTENIAVESKLENMYQLLGVMEIGDSKAAVIVNRNQPQRGPAPKNKTPDKRIYRLGDTLENGYKLSEIEQKCVKFVKDGREQELAMFQGKKGIVQAAPGNVPLPPTRAISRPARSLKIGAVENMQ